MVGNVDQLDLFCLAIQTMLLIDWHVKSFRFSNLSEIIFDLHYMMLKWVLFHIFPDDQTILSCETDD
jgi:hypothetical protein